MRVSPLSPAVRRGVTPFVAAGALFASLVLTAQGSWWAAGPGGRPGDTVRTVAEDGPLGLDSSERAAAELTGAHPVTNTTGDLDVRPAVARDPGSASPSGGGPDVSDLAVPARVLAAYRGASSAIRRSDSGCHLTWPLLAGIGKVESGHAYGGAVDSTGLTLRPILGPVLDGGPGVAAIRDSDGGRWDTDPTWDRAVGPMQFIPTSWRVHGADGNADGRDDPNNVADAALASGGYLCSGDRDLDVERHRRAAVFSYNHSWDYVDRVLAWADAYAGGTPVMTGDLPVLASSARTERPPACPECSPTRHAGNRRVALTPTAGKAVPSSSSTTVPEQPAPPVADPAPAEESPAPAVAAPAQTPPPDPGAVHPAPTPSACPTPTETPTPAETPLPTGSPSPSPSPTSSAEPQPTTTEPPGTTPSPSETTAVPSPSATPTPGPSCGPGSSG